MTQRGQLGQRHGLEVDKCINMVALVMCLGPCWLQEKLVKGTKKGTVSEAFSGGGYTTLGPRFPCGKETKRKTSTSLSRNSGVSSCQPTVLLEPKGHDHSREEPIHDGRG